MEQGGGERAERIEWNNVSSVVDVAVCSHFAGVHRSIFFSLQIGVQMTLIWTFPEQSLCAHKDALGRTRHRVQC